MWVTRYLNTGASRRCVDMCLSIPGYPGGRLKTPAGCIFRNDFSKHLDEKYSLTCTVWKDFHPVSQAATLSCRAAIFVLIREQKLFFIMWQMGSLYIQMLVRKVSGTSWRTVSVCKASSDRLIIVHISQEHYFRRIFVHTSYWKKVNLVNLQWKKIWSLLDKYIITNKV